MKKYLAYDWTKRILGTPVSKMGEEKYNLRIKTVSLFII